MVAFFENSEFYFKLERLFEQHNIQASGWRDYDCIAEHLREFQPSVVFLDIEIKGCSAAGLEALQLIKKRFPRIRVIVFTSHPEYVLKIFRSGAYGCLLKEESANAIENIRDAIEEVLHGKIFMSSEVRKIFVDSISPFEQISLNTRERQIVCLSANDKSGPQIAEALNLKSQTVETYLKNIKTKLSCHTIQGVVAKVLRNNMIDQSEFFA
jgi:DNA-binding NarL/FixJ family response regulator